MDKIINLDCPLKASTADIHWPLRDPDAAYMVKKHLEKYAGMPLSKIRSRSRKREIIRIRYALAFALWRYTGYTLRMLGEELGGRDHTTAIHNLNTVADYLETQDPFYYEFIMEFIDQMDGVLRVHRPPRARTAQKKKKLL